MSALHTLHVNLDDSKGTIHKEIYGHFSEHLGRCIYDGIWVGEESPIANIGGLRADIIEALRAIRVPVLRWPGGCFADEYHWKDGVGPKDQRRRLVNTTWGGVVEDNSFGTHEFFQLCEEVGCDAYVSGNVGSGSVREMQEWIEYITGPEASSLGAMRAKNGRREAWTLKYFGIGNECWGCGGNMTAEHYANVYRQYQTFVRGFGHGQRPLKIAAGSHDDFIHWTDVLMREAGRMMDGLSLHYYTIPGTWGHKGSATDFGVEEWFTTLKKSLVMEELVRLHGAVMDRYDPDHKVGLVVDEWGTWYDVEPGTNPSFLFQQNTLRDAMVAAITLNIFNNHCDRVTMANLAQTVNVLQSLLLTRDGQMIKTPTYHVFQLYAVHQGNQQVAVKTTTQSYLMGDAAIDQVHASASREASGTVHLSVVNLHHDQAAPLRIVIDSGEPWRIRTASGSFVSGREITSRNTFEEPSNVWIQPLDGVQVEGSQIVVTLPPRSIVQLTVR